MQGITQYILITLFATASHLHAQPNANPTPDHETRETRPLPPWQTYPGDNFTTTINKRFKPAKYHLARHSPTTQPENLNTTGTASIILSNTPLARLVQQIQDQSHTTITLHGINPQMKVTLIEPKPIPIEILLNRLTENVINIIVKQTGDQYQLWDKDTYAQENKTIVTYTLAETTAENARNMLIDLIPHEKANIVRDDRLNKLHINALPETHTEIATLLKQIDLKLYTRIFSLDHTDPRKMASQLATFLDVSASQLVSDERTNQLALTGTMAQLQRAEGLVTAFDIPTTTTQR